MRLRCLVDVADKERQYAELYVIMIGYGERWQPDIVQLIKSFSTGGRPREVGIRYAFSLGRNGRLGDGRRGRYVDGPLGFERWPAKCVGRVVGIIEAAAVSFSIDSPIARKMEHNPVRLLYPI